MPKADLTFGPRRKTGPEGPVMGLKRNADFNDWVPYRTRRALLNQLQRTIVRRADPIRLPGEMAFKREKSMRSRGVPVAGPVLVQLREIAHKLGLPDRLDDGR